VDLGEEDNILQKPKRHVSIGNVQIATIENKVKTPRREKFLPNEYLLSFVSLVESLENGVTLGNFHM